MLFFLISECACEINIRLVKYHKNFISTKYIAFDKKKVSKVLIIIIWKYNFFLSKTLINANTPASVLDTVNTRKLLI